MEESKVLTGFISNYIYSSEDSLYKVCKLETSDDSFIITGSFPILDEGLLYDFVGKFIQHSKYGEQFMVESYSKSNTFTESGLILYLSSEKFKGIGKKLATNIVEALGLDAINIIVNEPNKLDNVKGLNDSKKEVLINTIKDNYASEQVFIKLFSFGLTSKMVYKLYEAYGNSAASKIEKNPYCLIYEIDGYGFKKSDALAINMGFALDDDLRIKAALTYTVTFVCYNQGFTYLTYEQLINSTKNLLDNNSIISDEKYTKCLDELINENKLVFIDDKIFDSKLYNDERKCSNKIEKLYNAKAKLFSEKKIREALEYIEDLISIKYTDMQKNAIINALANKLSIITGGPGTGKSTILKGILLAYAYLNNMSIGCDELDYKVKLVAPTGRAAKRMIETTNIKATTIHKALGYSYDGGFANDEYNLLNCSLLIVDEASMVDITLASALFRALMDSCQIILVGDVNQLPSVGPGNVLYDLINSKYFVTTKLTQIMRQAKDSDIIKFSHMILNENIAYEIFKNKKEIFLYHADAKETINQIFRILDNFINSGGDLYNGIQILVPMYAGPAGIDAINIAIQNRYNGSTDKMIVRDNVIFKQNDKVLQLKNDSQLDIMNGDIGKIIDISKVDDKDVMRIDFDGRIVTYHASDLENLKLAYAISIHKAQGSEFDNVIMPILPSYQVMLKKKILYTGVTRAKKKLIIIGKADCIEKAIHTYDYLRQTSLCKELNEVKKVVKNIFDDDIPFDTLGEYDMEDITPYSFM